MALGKTLPAMPTRRRLAAAFAAAIEAVKARGKSEVGPEDDARRAGAGAGGARRRRGARPPVQAEALAAAEATRPMKAIRGRASFLGERSIGHVDPGARSSALMIAAVCDAIGG